jgi:CRISPR-associated protein Cmr6
MIAMIRSKKMSDFSKDWEDFIASLRKGDKNHEDPNSLYSLLKASQLLQENDQYLMIALPSEVEVSRARKKFAKIQQKMPPRWQSSKRLKFCLLPTNPLQSLNHKPLDYEVGRPNLALVASINTEKKRQDLYDDLNKRTEMLASHLLDVEFASSVRVGGPRGFLDTLLSVFHPVYGVPYIPASTLKGIFRAWADKNWQNVKVDRVLGPRDCTSLGTVQFFDAFPMKPCLALDVVTPNWSWNGIQEVKYKAEPHVFLVMNKPTLKIGVATTSIGNEKDVECVSSCLKEALACGLGSRTSAGYGRVANRPTTLPKELVRGFSFEMKTQGIYGADPRSPEFRITAVRGILRYWFRAIALGIYSPKWCKRLEAELFGSIETDFQDLDKVKPTEGAIRLSVKLSSSSTGNSTAPFEYKGEIYLESKDEQCVEVVEKLLILASHLSGVGRGSRRPLHKNSGRWRGCFWRLTEHQYDIDQFQGMVDAAISAVRSLGRDRADYTPHISDPGLPNARKQDVLDASARLFLLPQQGLGATQRGKAMVLLYKPEYKGGVPSRSGNPYVAGAANKSGSTPSYVTIQTNLPPSGLPYEAVIVFGAASEEVPKANNRESYGSRSQFCADILRLEGVRELSL